MAWFHRCLGQATRAGPDPLFSWYDLTLCFFFLSGYQRVYSFKTDLDVSFLGGTACPQAPLPVACTTGELTLRLRKSSAERCSSVGLDCATPSTHHHGVIHNAFLPTTPRSWVLPSLPGPAQASVSQLSLLAGLLWNVREPGPYGEEPSQTGCFHWANEATCSRSFPGFSLLCIYDFFPGGLLAHYFLLPSSSDKCTAVDPFTCSRAPCSIPAFAIDE